MNDVPGSIYLMQEYSDQNLCPEEASSLQGDSTQDNSSDTSSSNRFHQERRGPRHNFSHPDNRQKNNNNPHRTQPAQRPAASSGAAPSTPKPERPFTHSPNRKFNAEREPQKRPDGRNIRQPFDGAAHLYEVIQVRLVRTQRLVEVNTNSLRLGPNTPVLVRVHRNILLATTVGYRHRRVAEINSLPFVVRIATDEDKAIDADNELIERKAQELASDYAINQNLQMKVLSADLSHDHKNITINFASDVRVDFREMVAYMAGQLKLRVEMYQLGLRNGTGIICGLGSCGQRLCCGRFLGQFDPIAVKQLRAQGLATNPKRISGVCGRLYCCMSYEYCDYMKERRSLPKKGRRVFSRWGIGRITDIDMLREEVVVTYENGESQRLTPNDFILATDEIAAKVEAGEYEFPLEPAKFYLNQDPSSAAEAETQTRPNKSHAAPKRMDATTKKPVTTRKPIRPAVAAPVQAADNASESSVENKAEKAAHTRRHRTVARHHTTDVSKPQTAENQTSQEPRCSQEKRIKAVSPVPKPGPENATAIVPEVVHHHHVTRKVRAHQANLEEAMNANAEARNTPSRTSRRRFSPLPPSNPGNNT